MVATAREGTTQKHAHDTRYSLGQELSPEATYAPELESTCFGTCARQEELVAEATYHAPELENACDPVSTPGTDGETGRTVPDHLAPRPDESFDQFWERVYSSPQPSFTFQPILV